MALPAEGVSDRRATLSARDLLALQAFELAHAAVRSRRRPRRCTSRRRRSAIASPASERTLRGSCSSAVRAVSSCRRVAAGSLPIPDEAFGELSRALAHPVGGGRRLRLSCVPIFASHWLLPRLGDFLAAHPDIELQVEASPRMADMETGWSMPHCVMATATLARCSAERILQLQMVR